MSQQILKHKLRTNRIYLKNYEPENIYLDIPYLPGENKLHKSLSHNTISVNAYSRRNDPSNNFYTMYNVKSLISKIQVKITNEYLTSVNKRPFIVSRANTIGHGKYAFHWLGDNISTFNCNRFLTVYCKTYSFNAAFFHFNFEFTVRA